MNNRLMSAILVVLLIVMILHPGWTVVSASGDQQEKNTSDTEPVKSTESCDPTEPDPTGTEEPEEPIVTDPVEPPVQYYSVQGVVKNEDGEPVNEASVTLFDPVTGERIKKGSTDREGFFKLEEVPGGDLQLTVSAGDDYALYATDITLEGDLNLGNIRISYMRFKATMSFTNVSGTYSIEGQEPTSGFCTNGSEILIRKGDRLTVSIHASAGCQLVSVTCNGERPTMNNSNMSFTVEAQSDLAIVAIAADITAPEIDRIVVSNETDWAQSKIATITVHDNISTGAAIRLYWSEQSMNDPADVISEGVTVQDRAILLTENGTIFVYAIDAANNMSSAEFSVSKIDNTAPVVSELTPSTSEGTHEVEYSFTATDNGVIASIVWIAQDGSEHELAINESNHYSFSVTENGEVIVKVTDAAGNATTVSTTAGNIDWDPPAITVLPQQSWDAESNIVQIAVTDASAIYVVEVIDDQGTATKIENADGRYSYTANHNGQYSVRAVDVAGNEASVPFTVDHIDTQSPVITDTQMDPDVEWTAEAIVVTVSTEDLQSGIKGLRYRFASDSDSSWVELDADEGQTVFSFTIPNESSLMDHCQIIAEDNVGRLSDVTEIYFQIDVDAPQISSLTPNTNTGAHEITYTFTATDNGALASIAWSLNEGEQQVLELTENGLYAITVSENGLLTVTATDKAGNSTSVDTTVNQIDWNPPTIAVAPQQTWDATTNEVRISVTDDFGVATVEVIDAMETAHQVVADGADYVFTATENGSYRVRAVDDAGNEAFAPFVVAYIDQNAPVITAVHKEPASEWTASSITITVNTFDGESGIKALYYRFASDSGEDSWNMIEAAEGQTEFTFVIPNAQNHTDSCQIVAEDNVGRKSEQAEIGFKIDIENPVISEIVPSTVGGTHAVIYTFSVTDNGEIAAVCWMSPDGVQHDLALNEENRYAFAATSNGTVTVKATDKAGNSTSVSVVVSNIDWNAPIVTVQPQQTWDAAQNDVQITVTDEFAIAVVEVLDADGTAHPVTVQGTGYAFSTQENGAYTVRAVDEAGNESLTPFTVDHIDTEKPVITSVQKNPDSDWTANSVVITVSTSDSQSGIRSMLYRFASSEDDSWYEVFAADGQTQFTITIPNDKDWHDICLIVAEDNVGRKSDMAFMEFGVDVSAPVNFVLEMDKGEGSGFFTFLTNLFDYGLLYRDFITFHAYADDPSSGVAYYEYQFVQKDQAPQENGWIQMTLVEQDGKVSAKAIVKADDFAGYLHVRAYDNCGNAVEYATNRENDDSFIIVLENTPKTDEERAEAPALSAKTGDGTVYVEGVWTNQSVTVSAEAEGAISGVKRYEFQIVSTGTSCNDTAWQEAPGGKVTVSNDSNVDVYFRAVSYAENASRASHLTVRVQKTPPQNAVVTVTGTQGINKWYISIPGIAITEPTPAPGHAKIKTWFNLHAVGAAGEDLLYGVNRPVIHGDGVYELVVWTVDEAGNYSGKSTQIISVDTTAPTDLRLSVDGTIILAGNQNSAEYKHIYSRSITVQASSNCNVSGQLSVSYQKVYDMSQYNANGTWTSWPQNGLQIVPDENCVIYLRVTDNAGNTTIVHSDGLILDRTAPSGPNSTDIGLSVIGANANGYFSGNGTVDVKVIDPEKNGAYAGLRSISYEVIRDGIVTQNETIRVGESGVNIKQTELTRGNNNAVNYWNGRITVLAAENNSDNIIVRVTAVDVAGNTRRTETRSGAVKIDTTAPVAEISYENNKANHDSGSYYFDANRKIKIIITDRTLGDNKLIVTRNGETYPAALQWVKTAGVLENGDDTRYEASFSFSEDGEYGVSFEAKDLAGSKLANTRFSYASIATSKFIIDKTKPTVEVSYDNNTAFNECFFDGQRTATITITDACFDPGRVELNIKAQKDGADIAIPTLSAWKHEGDKHEAAVTFSEEGDYTRECKCTDRAGNHSDRTSYHAETAPTSFTVDTTPVSVTVDGLDNHCAYNGDLAPVITFQDINMYKYDIQLKATNMEQAGLDVTKDIVSGDQDGELKLTFSKQKDLDGIYHLTYSFQDKAGHVTEGKYDFTVNRNGSVFEYSPDLLTLLDQHVMVADGEYFITEYNPSPVSERAMTITVDGTPLAEPAWTYETLRENGEKWYNYKYLISPENFGKDGLYKVVFASEDGADNRTEATPDIRFWVDTTAPEIQLIKGMEDSIINASSQKVDIQVYDAIGLAAITVYLTDHDGNSAELLNKTFENNETESSEEVIIKEGLRQHLRVVVVDLAGNVIDSDAEGYAPAFEFADKITVSRNLLTRWYANPWIFFGSLFGIIAVSAGIVVLIVAARKHKKKRGVNLR